MRFLVYFITMTSYISIHAMRMTLPFLGIYISQSFGLDNKTLGLGNATSYLILALGYILFSFKPPEKKKLTYLAFAIMSALGFALIPLYTLFGIKSIALFFISTAIFGFFQSTSWSTLLAIIHLYFKPSSDGRLLGIWGSSIDLGNTAGFTIIIIMLYMFHCPWQTAMFLEALLVVALGIGIYLLPVQQNQLKQDEGQQSTSEFKYLLKNLKDPYPIYILTHICLLKALIYGILLWVPLYLQKKGLAQFAGVIPIAYSLSSLLGSSSLGTFYQLVRNRLQRHSIFIIINIVALVMLCLIQIIQIDVQHRWYLVFIFGVLGFCYSGKCNILLTNQSMLFCTKKYISVYIWGGFQQAVGFLMISIFQILIGVLTSSNQQILFSILIGMNAGCILIEVIYTIYLCITNTGSKDEQDFIEQEIPNEIFLIE